MCKIKFTIGFTCRHLIVLFNTPPNCEKKEILNKQTAKNSGKLRKAELPPSPVIHAYNGYTKITRLELRHSRNFGEYNKI